MRALSREEAHAPWVHFAANNTSGHRLFTHWYTFLLFDDLRTDRFAKRWVRDNVHYRDEIACAAARVAAALGERAARRGAASYSAVHVRRGELQYLSVRPDAAALAEALGELGVLRGELLYARAATGLSLPAPTASVGDEAEARARSLSPLIRYVATDERERAFFAPLRAAGFELAFLDDFAPLLHSPSGHVDPNAYGMVEQLVCADARARLFVGTWFSTLSAHVLRLRAYRGHADGTSLFHSPPAKRRCTQSWRFPEPAWYPREWPLAWDAIDEPAPAPDATSTAMPERVVPLAELAVKVEEYPEAALKVAEAARAAERKAAQAKAAA